MGLINPPKKKKCYAPSGAGNSVVEAYLDLIEKISSKPKKSKFLELKTLLADQKDNEAVLQIIANRTTHEFITKLLIAYTGTQSQADLWIFDILKLYERAVKFNFKPLLPLVCGPNTESHYSNLIKLGRAVHICPKPDEVLQGLNSSILWDTGVHSCLFDPENPEQPNPLHYDPRYLSMLFLGMVGAGADLTLKSFIERNALSFAAFILSHPHENIRMYGYAILWDFLLKLQDISAEDFTEKSLYIYTLIYLKDNIKQVNMKVGNACAHFFARVFKLYLEPENPVFKKIVSFLSIKENFRTDVVPEFFRMFLSTATQTFKEERIWVLELATSSMLTSNDYVIFEQSSGVSLCLSMFTSPFCDKATMRHIFFLLQKIVTLPSGAKDLCNRHNFHSWVSTAIQFETLTRWEIGFLSQIFFTYVQTLDTTEGKSEVFSKKRKLIYSCARKVTHVVGSAEDEVKEKWFQKLQNLGKLGDKNGVTPMEVD